MRTILRIIAAVVGVTAAGLSGGCASKQSPATTPDPKVWLIESYTNGTITARNDGKVYTATCEGHRILKADQLVYDSVPSFPCTMAIEGVGTSAEPITWDTDFRTSPLVMGKGPGGSLVLRRQDIIETFAVKSVTTAH